VSILASKHDAPDIWNPTSPVTTDGGFWWQVHHLLIISIVYISIYSL
jgi:hypothetical protein